MALKSRLSSRLLLYFILCCPMAALAQQNTLHYFFTTEEHRHLFYDALVKYSINKNLSGTLDNADGIYDFESSFWPMKLVHYKTSFVKERLAYAFTQTKHLGTGFQRGLLEVVYTNWPEDFHDQVTWLINETKDPKIFAMCAEYLWQNGTYPESTEWIEKLLQERFGDRPKSILLRILSHRLAQHKRPEMPSISSLIAPQFAKGLTVIYSFQRPDRKYPGRVIVRRPDGRFVTDSTGALFSTSQIGLSLSNLPFYLTNGNTPQGLYRMNGFGSSSSRFIGPTENIQMSMPHEIKADSFFIQKDPHFKNKTIQERYRHLLPEEWQAYPPMYESLYAGEAGRTEVIAHGTTVNPAYYEGTSYFPNTPTLGCLCAYEDWDAQGVRQASGQQLLVNAVKEAGGEEAEGYVVVLDLEDRKAPVSVEEVEQIISTQGL